MVVVERFKYCVSESVNVFVVVKNKSQVKQF